MRCLQNCRNSKNEANWLPFFYPWGKPNVERVVRETFGIETTSELSPKQALEKYFAVTPFSSERAQYLGSLAEKFLLD